MANNKTSIAATVNDNGARHSNATTRDNAIDSFYYYYTHDNAIVHNDCFPRTLIGKRVQRQYYQLYVVVNNKTRGGQHIIIDNNNNNKMNEK